MQGVEDPLVGFLKSRRTTRASSSSAVRRAASDRDRLRFVAAALKAFRHVMGLSYTSERKYRKTSHCVFGFNINVVFSVKVALGPVTCSLMVFCAEKLGSAIMSQSLMNPLSPAVA